MEMEKEIENIQDTIQYKVVYYKNNQMFIDKCTGKQLKDPYSKYRKYHTRIYPTNYEPLPPNGYHTEQLITSW